MAVKRTRLQLLAQTWRGLTARGAPRLQRLGMFLRFCRLSLSLTNPKVGDLLGVPRDVREAAQERLGAAGATGGGQNFDWDGEIDALREPVMNPVLAFHEAVKQGPGGMSPDNPFRETRVEVDEAFLFEGHFNERGQLLRDPKALREVNRGWPKPYLIRHVRGHEAYKARVAQGEAAFGGLAAKAQFAREVRAARRALAGKLKREGFGDSFAWEPDTLLDPNQYTEFAPIMGGPFYKQLYLYDYLKQHAYAFEAWNHNPLAKRIIQLLGQYTIGRRFTLRVKNKRQEKAWEEAERLYKITNKIADFWVNEANIYGELFIDKTTWQSVDPSTIWDIITDPENVDDAYYAYQSYPTQYQQFTGYRVPGEPGSQNVQAQKYVIKQIPMAKLLHLKLNCVSNEKRGRTVLFPILGWMKRVKDLYNAQVIRQWLTACFMWDVEIDGDQADVDAYSAAYGGIPQPASTHVHNKSVKRTPMAALEQGSGQQGAGTISDSVLSFIATAVGIPREFLNILSVGGGSRAQALTSAEPFTKVIEDLQSKWEDLIKAIFEAVMVQAGLPYAPGDVEVLFPSVTKDTTTETLKNLQTGESMGWISKRTAAAMAAKELNITEYDFEEEQQRIRDDEANGLNLTGSAPLPPGGRLGLGLDVPGDDEPDGGSPIHGDGKRALKDELTNL